MASRSDAASVAESLNDELDSQPDIPKGSCHSCGYRLRPDSNVRGAQFVVKDYVLMRKECNHDGGEGQGTLLSSWPSSFGYGCR